VCPSSNVLLGIVPDIGSHPLPALMRAGVACSLNADDPLFFGVGVAEEYTRARERLGLSDDQLADLARASLNASAAPPGIVRNGIRKIDEWLVT
jgi:adenosine deaminase